MRSFDDETTNGPLLERLGDWTDHDAWMAFVDRYDRLVRRAVGARRLGPEATEEVCQRVWIELARRMRGYRYDPSRRFRAWLTRLCHSRALDHWRRHQAERARGGSFPFDEPAAPELPEHGDPARSALLRRAERVQEAVRDRVDARTWDVFWRIAVDDEAIVEVAEAVGISYAAAFAAQKRVRRMLREEAERVGAEAEAETVP